MLLPGDPTLTVQHFAANTNHLRVLFSRPADTTEREYSQLTRQETVADGRLIQSFEYPPPRSVKDSLVVKRDGLVPEYETLSLGKAVIALRYQGPKVIATVKQNDSTRTFERSFPHDVFAFNQLDAIIRSLDYRAGFSAVVPLFSEQDLKLEYDTVSVLGDEVTPDKHRAWRVRFADPVIFSEYVVDAESRRILSQLTTQRASQAHFRYEIVKPD